MVKKVKFDCDFFEKYNYLLKLAYSYRIKIENIILKKKI